MPKLTRRLRLAVREPKRAGSRVRAVALGLTVVLACGVGAGFVRAFGTRETAIEEVVRRSDLVVLGKVTSKDPHETTGPHLSGTFTRNTFRVEAYYKGEGPEEISLLTHGGVWTRPDGTVTETVAVGAEGVREGEEMVAFLRAGPGGYYFVGWGGNAKRLVKTDQETGERTVEIRLSKKKYMKGPALAAFDRMQALENPVKSTAEVEAELTRSGGLGEAIPVKELATRLGEIIRGEAIQANP